MNQETNAQNAPSEVIDAVMTAGALKTTSVYLEGPDDPAWLRDMHTANSEAVAAIVSFDGWEDRPGDDEMSVGMNIELELMALQARIKLGLMAPGAVRMSLKALLRLGASLSPCHPQLQDSELASDIRLSNQSRVKEIIRYVQSSTPDGAPDMMRPSRHRQFSESGYVASSGTGIFSEVSDLTAISYVYLIKQEALESRFMLERLQQGIDTQERCGYLIIEVRGGETDSRECRLTCKGSTFLSLGFAFIILYRLVVKEPAVIGENDAFYLGMFMYIGLLSGVHWWTTDALRNLPGRPGSEQQWCLSCVNGVNIFAAAALCMATITYMVFPPDVNGVVFGMFALTGTLSAGYAVYRSVTVMYLVERLKKAPPAGYHELNAYSLLVEVPTPTVSTPGVRRKLVQ